MPQKKNESEDRAFEFVKYSENPARNDLPKTEELAS